MSSSVLRTGIREELWQAPATGEKRQDVASTGCDLRGISINTLLIFWEQMNKDAFCVPIISTNKGSVSHNVNLYTRIDIGVD